MTEAFFNELKTKVKDLVILLKHNDVNSINISLSDLKDLTVCNVECEKTENTENFMYFFNNLDLQNYNNNFEESKSNIDNTSNNSSCATDVQKDFQSTTNTTLDKSKEEISVTMLKDNVCLEEHISSDKDNDNTNNDDEYIDVTELQDSFDCTDINEDIQNSNCSSSFIEEDATSVSKNTSSISNSNRTNEDIKTVHNTNCSNTNSGKSPKVINFKEENAYQKETITRILKEFNLLN